MPSLQFQIQTLPTHPLYYASFSELLRSINQYRHDTFPSHLDLSAPYDIVDDDDDGNDKHPRSYRPYHHHHHHHRDDKSLPAKDSLGLDTITISHEIDLSLELNSSDTNMSRSTPPNPRPTSPMAIPTKGGYARSSSLPRHAMSVSNDGQDDSMNEDIPEGLKSPRQMTIPLATSAHAHDHHGDRLHEVQDEEASPIIDAVMPELLRQTSRPHLNERSISQSSMSSVESEFFENRVQAIQEESAFEAANVNAKWTPPSPPRRRSSHSHHDDHHDLHPLSPLASPAVRPTLPHPGSHHHHTPSGSFSAHHMSYTSALPTSPGRHSPGRHSPHTPGRQSPLSTSVPLIPVDELVNAENVPPYHHAHGEGRATR